MTRQTSQGGAVFRQAKKVWQVFKPLLPKHVRDRLFAIVDLNETDLVHRAAQADLEWGVMVDVGAHYGSTLRPFARGGWTVHAFEPDPDNRAVLSQHVAHMENVHVDTRALSDHEEVDVPFFSSEVSSGISGLSTFEETHRERTRVDLIPFSRYCEEKGVTQVDVMKIDTEGFDLFVLKGIPWDRIQPGLIVTEFEDRKSVPLGYNFHDMAEFLDERGYRVLVSEWFPVVRYGGSHKWRSFWTYPGELQGAELAHGNIIAVRDEELFRRIVRLTRSWPLRSFLRNRLLGL